MRSSATRILSLVLMAVWVCAAAAALAAPGLAAPEAELSLLSPPNGMFDALQRDMLMLKDRLEVVVAAIPQLPGNRSVAVAAPNQAI